MLFYLKIYKIIWSLNYIEYYTKDQQEAFQIILKYKINGFFIYLNCSMSMLYSNIKTVSLQPIRLFSIIVIYSLTPIHH
jgi:protoheme ferro-lyase